MISRMRFSFFRASAVAVISAVVRLVFEFSIVFVFHPRRLHRGFDFYVTAPFMRSGRGVAFMAASLASEFFKSVAHGVTGRSREFPIF